jgi:formamidopyrimidine-DNA glycosylase
MPELPEVEIARRRLESRLAGRRIQAVRVVDPKLMAGCVPGALSRLEGRSFERIERRGKYLGLRSADGPFLLIHLRMTGRFVFANRAPESLSHPVRCLFELDDEGCVLFRDPRRFGQFQILEPDELANNPQLVALGPDALRESPNAAALAALAGGRRQSIKALLMDQRRLAGLGNICAIEILYRAGIAPQRPAGNLTAEEVRCIAEIIPPYLEWAIARQESRELIYLGERGAENVFTIYRRAGRTCPGCGSTIVRVRLAGRGTYYCPGCQT